MEQPKITRQAIEEFLKNDKTPRPFTKFHNGYYEVFDGKRSVFMSEQMFKKYQELLQELIIYPHK